MVRAVARGAIDYRDFDPHDPADRLREYLLLVDIADEASAQLLSIGTLRSSFNLVTAAIAKQQQAADSAVSRGADLYNKLVVALMPWTAPDTGWTADIKNVASELVRWERAFGKMDSPEVKEKLKKFQALSDAYATVEDGFQRLM